MKKSWKTTLGGALASLGTFLWGAPVALKTFDVAMPVWVPLWCILAGLVANAAGVFIAGLFSRDNDVTSEDVKEAKAKGSGSPWLLAAALVPAAVGAAACASIVRPAPGSDPLVVRAEWLAENALGQMDSFLAWEHANRPALGGSVREAAAALRRPIDGKPAGRVYLEDYGRALRDYKRSRSADDASKLRSATEALLSLLNSLRAHQGLPAITLPQLPPSPTDLMGAAPANAPPSNTATPTPR
jgi:hypothetical protein